MKSSDPWGLASDGTSVWVYNPETGVVQRITAASGAVAATIRLKPGCGRSCGNLAVGDGAVWVANDTDGSITRIDASTNKVVATIQAGSAPHVFTTPGAAWAANYFSDSYTRIDTRTNAVTTLSHHLSASAVAYVGGAVWLCDASGSPALTRLDAATGVVQKQVDVVSGGSKVFCFAVVALGSRLYVLTDNDANPQVVDPATGAGAEARPPGDPQSVIGVAGGADGSWLLDAKLGLFRLDPATGNADALTGITGGDGIADDGHAAWVITTSGTLYRVVAAG